MRDARDAEDKRLLDDGNINALLGGYVEIIRGRCIAKMRGPVGEDVAQVVCLRLWKELKLGKHRDGRWPFRVIVHKVIDYTCAGWYEQGWGESELLEIDGPATDGQDAIIGRLDLEAFIATLPAGDGAVATLGWLEGLEAAEIATVLEKDPNAVHQAAFRNRRKLREWLEEAG